MGSEGLEDIRRQPSNITKWMADSMEQISRDRAGWRRSRRRRRLIITPDGSRKKKNIV